MSRVSYDNKKLQPAPLVAINKTFNKATDGTIIGSTFRLVVQGTIMSWKGSPTSSGTWNTSSGYLPDENVGNDSRLAAMLRKQDAIRDLFSTEGLSFEIQSLDGSQPLKCNPRILEVDIPAGVWYETCPYTITLEADALYPMQEDTFTAYINSASESWSIDTNETPENLDISRTYQLGHTVSAQGKRFYDNTGTLQKEAWEQARDYVLSRLGFDSVIALSSGVNNLPTYYGGYNHLRNEQIDKLGGTYSVTENWTLTSGNALETFNITTQNNIDSPYTTVSIEGNITGLEQRSSGLTMTVSKFTNANTKYTNVSGLAFTRAQNYSGRTLNIVPLGTTVATNPVAGTINYTYNYDDRPSNVVTDAKVETIQIAGGFGVDVFGQHVVIGRSRGPVLQDINTKQVCERNLTIELVFPASYIPVGTSMSDKINTYNPRLHSPQSADIASIIAAARPSGHALNNIGSVASKEFVTNRSETWDHKQLRYSLQMGWVYE